jgi:hypothetical protein
MTEKVLAFRRDRDQGARALSRVLQAMYLTEDSDTRLTYVAAGAAEVFDDQAALDRLSDTAIHVHGLAADDVQNAIAKGINRALDKLAEQPERNDPDMTLLRLNRRPPPVLPLSVLGGTGRHGSRMQPPVHPRRLITSLRRSWPQPAP